MCGEGWTYLKLNILMHPELEKLEQEENESFKIVPPWRAQLLLAHFSVSFRPSTALQMLLNVD